jgi:small subunit ribosomal protein S6
MSKKLSVERAYECLFICPVETPQKTIDSFIEKLKATLQPTKGLLKGVQIWGRRRLTYPIKHHRDGLFIFLDYSGQTETNKALANLFHVTDFVLRHMISHKVVLNPPVVRKPPQAVEAGAAAAAPATTEAHSKESPSA